MPVETQELKNKLKRVLREANQEQERLKLLFQLFERLKNTDIAEAWAFAREALCMAQEQKDEQGMADAHLAMADCLWKMAQISLAVEHYELALNIYVNLQDHEGVARCFSGMGIVSAETGEFIQSLEYFEHAKRYIKLSPASKWSAVITSNIGHVYLKLHRHRDAMNSFENALETYIAFRDEEGEANVLGGIAGLHVQNGDYDKALETMERVKELRRSEEPEPGRRMAIAMMNTGITLLRMGQFRNAKQELEQALELMKSVHFAMYEPEILKHLMHASVELDDMIEFNKYLYLYEEFRHEDIIQEARDRHKRFREFQAAETQSIQNMLN